MDDNTIRVHAHGKHCQKTWELLKNRVNIFVNEGYKPKGHAVKFNDGYYQDVIKN